MLSGFEASAGAAVAWPIEARQWQKWFEDQPNKIAGLMQLLDDLRQQAEAGTLDNQDAKAKAIDLLIGLHDPHNLLGLRRMDCEETQAARKIVAGIIRDFKPVQAEPAKRVILEGLYPSEFA